MRVPLGPARICIVTPGWLSSNPRVVKEADALFEAGYDVHVIASDWPPLRPFDSAVIARAKWTYTLVPYPTGVAWLAQGIGRRMAGTARRLGADPGALLATRAHHSLTPALRRAAQEAPADLYIAHYLAALPAAAAAAEMHGGRLGFDAEDFHTGELEDTPEHRPELDVRRAIERTFLPRCDYLTAASPLIAEAYAQTYGVRPSAILNVFPLSDRPDDADAADRRPAGAGPSLYWFSQTISSDRGLACAISALSHMRCGAQLFLRGTPANGCLDVLRSHARERGVEERVHVLGRAVPDEMISLAAEHDIGLSLEERSPLNRDICLTNKLFTYLAAGLPQIMSKTRAQCAIAADLGEAAQLVDGDDPVALAQAVDELLLSPERLRRAKSEASRLARERYNWEVEKTKLVDLATSATATRPGGDAKAARAGHG